MATFKEQIEQYLSGLPKKWADQLTELLCLIKAEKQEPDCQTVKDCETVTTLSNFTVNGSVVSIQYKNEQGVTVTRSFDTSTVVNDSLDDIDPQCLTDQVTWDSMTLAERLQLLIDTICNCNGPSSAPRIFDTEMTDPTPCAGTVQLFIDGLPIGGEVSFGLNAPLSSIADDLNNEYDGFATFEVSETGITTTLIADGYIGIDLQFNLTCE